MPGLTKVLLIAQDFPLLNLKPEHHAFKDASMLNVITQAA
jgi:hypothetical protein